MPLRHAARAAGLLGARDQARGLARGVWQIRRSLQSGRRELQGKVENPDDNVDNCKRNIISSSCQPTTFNQPCDWRNNPALLGKTVYVLPLGPHDQNYPFACAAGVLGGNAQWIGPHPADERGVCGSLR